MLIIDLIIITVAAVLIRLSTERLFSESPDLFIEDPKGTIELNDALSRRIYGVN